MKVCIIGGGAAGLMAGALLDPPLDVVILEKNGQCGRKLLMTGNGRCNLTNHKPLNLFLQACNKEAKFLYGALSHFGPTQIMDYFTSRGCLLKEEEDQRVFPQSDKAQDILSVLLTEIKQRGHRIERHCEVLDWIQQDGRVIGVESSLGPIMADIFIVACGGLSYPKTGSTGKGLDLAKKLGHQIMPCYGVEVGLLSQDPVIEGKFLQGMTLYQKPMRLWIDGKKKREKRSNLLITHYGLSGPAVLEWSEEAIVALNQGQKVEIGIQSQEEFDLHKIVDVTPKRWSSYLLEDMKDLNHLVKKDLVTLRNRVMDYRFEVVGSRPLALATVTAGGISCKELDPKSMVSKFADNVAFVGESLNVHGNVGGYNLTLAWASSNAVAKSLNDRLILTD